MAALTDPAPAVSSLVIAALLICARRFLRRLALPHPTVEQIIEATGAKRSRAYELAARLVALLPTLQRPAGRPAAAPPTPAADTSASLSRAVIRFMKVHPGCVHGVERQRYSDAFRHFIVELRAQHPQVELGSFAAAVELPVGTLKDWVANSSDRRSLPSHELNDGGHGNGGEHDPSVKATTPHIETVLAAWNSWDGSFVGFCEHVQCQWRVPFGRTLIARILEVHGVRLPRQRRGRSPDEQALRASFATFFPGAQWVGDGTAIDVVIDGEVFTFTLELMVDTWSGAFVGVSIRNEEDSRAVVQAFDDGVCTTGEAPLCLLLDNKPANHTGEVDEALGDTLRMRSTLGRAQNKAHVEGAFGLFQQSAPPLELTVHRTAERDTAEQVLGLVVQTWVRVANHRPRRDRNGRSRVELYRDTQPSDEQIAQARASLQERARKQRLARQTREARQDPIVRRTLDEAFERLLLADPERHIRNAIARYPLDAVVNGIATFEGKRNAHTLPDGVDARYLLGIVKNLSDKNEGQEITEALIRQRLAARDHMVAALQRACDDARKTTDPSDLPRIFVDRALDSQRHLDTLFWLDSAASAIRQNQPDDPISLFRSVSRQIHSAFRVPHRERLDAVRIIANKLIPLATP